MGSQLDDIMAEVGVDVLFEHLADSAIVVRYLDPPHADPVELTAIIGPDRTVEVGDEKGREHNITREVTISADPDSEYGGVAAPKLSATIEIDGVDWAIESIVSQDANTVKLTVSKSPQSGHGRGGYRGH